MKKKPMICIVLLITVLFCSTVYGVMQDQDYTLNIGVINNKKVIDPLKDLADLHESRDIEFIMDKTGLSKGTAKFLVEQCDKKDLDLFLVLGLMKVESNFNNRLVGTSGERGLGQLMDITARALAKNMEIEYNPKLLFDPKYNILLFTTHLRYLNKTFSGDIHKVLTAYNRGETGLKRYITSRSSKRQPAKSIYSDRVIEYAGKFKAEYDKQDD